MGELIKYQEQIKEWSLEQLLDQMCKESYWCDFYKNNEESRKKYDGRVFLIKMEIVSRFNDK